MTVTTKTSIFFETEKSLFWLGCGVKVLDGVSIGKGSVIGAGSVVTRSIPSYSVAFGVPAAVKRKRGDQELGEDT